MCENYISLHVRVYCLKKNNAKEAYNATYDCDQWLQIA